MRIEIEPGIRLFVDVEGASLVPDGPTLREKPTLNLLPGLARAQCPVLVIGGEDDPVTPIEDQRDIAAALPSRWVAFHAFAGAGQGVDHDREAEFMALVRSFIPQAI